MVPGLCFPLGRESFALADAGTSLLWGMLQPPDFL